MAGRKTRTYDTPRPADVPAGEVRITPADDGKWLAGIGRAAASGRAYTKFMQVQSEDEARALFVALGDTFGFKTVSAEKKHSAPVSDAA